MVLPSYEPYEAAHGALAIIVRELGRELGRRAVDVVVVGPAPARPWAPGTRFRPVPARSTGQRVIDRRPTRAGAPARHQDRYRRQVRARLADRDHVVVMNDLDLALGLGRGQRSATWVFAENEIVPERAQPAEVAELDGLLACSPSIRDWLEARYPLDPGFVRVVPNGVDLELFTPGPLPAPVEAPGVGLGAELRGVFVGRIDPNKGILELLEATATVRRAGVAFSLSVAGPVAAWGLEAAAEADLVAEFERAVARAGARYLGAIDRPATARLMAEADLVFVPSVSSEPFGLTAVEALASGSAVVLSDRGALPWIGGSAAVIVEPAAAALAQAITELAGDPARRAALARAGPVRARDFTWSRVGGPAAGRPRPGLIDACGGSIRGLAGVRRRAAGSGPGRWWAPSRGPRAAGCLRLPDPPRPPGWPAHPAGCAARPAHVR